MAYYTEITSSQTWTCPRTGDYKITCVAGGGGLDFTNGVVLTSGGSTSFGTHMTCSGHIIANNPSGKNNIAVNGYVPTRPEIYAAPCAVADGVIGYGGAATAKHANSQWYGLCGNLEKKIVHIEEGAKVACTVGAAGEVVAANSTSNPGTGGFISIQEV